MTDLRELQFYATPEHTCSYLEERQAKTLFVDPSAQVDQAGYSLLSDLGFRRSGPHLYRPHCDNCSACISARIPVNLFEPNRSQRRILRRNRDLSVSAHEPELNDELYQLYRRYINARHHDGDMYPPSPEQFESFLVQSHHRTRFYHFRRDQQLVAVAVMDQLDQGLSAIYTFFDPDLSRRSLGQYAIMRQVEITRSQGLPFLYLGYWIRGCQKMSYKIKYQPIQLLIDGRWFQWKG